MSGTPLARAGSGVVRVLIAALGVGLTALAVLHQLGWNRANRGTVALLASTGLAIRQPGLVAAAVFDPDPVRSRLAIARALLAEAYDPRAFSTLPARAASEAASRVGERLDLARAIGAQAFAQLPAAWQAAMIVGASTYRLWSFAGDPRVLSDRAAWQAPMQAAVRLAPGEDEPLRPLAAAWLEIWPYLSPGERQDARATLRRAFTDPQTFALCARLWLAVEPDRKKVFSLVPDTSWAWADLQRIYAGVRDWDGYCLASDLQEAALARELQARLQEAADRRRGGDPSGARQLAVGVVADAPVDRRFAPAVREALAVCPPGPIAGAGGACGHWLQLALDGFVRGRAWLPPEAVARLAEGAGDLPAATQALAQLAGDNLVGAEVIERRSETLNTEAWAPYWIAKALVLARARRIPEAQAALTRVNRSWEGSLPMLGARVAALTAAGDADGLAAARAALDGAAAASWRGTDWQWRGAVARLDLRAVRDASGIALGLDEAPSQGAVVAVSLDGKGVAVVPVPASGELDVAARVSRGSHLLEVTAVAGGRVVPGHVALVE